MQNFITFEETERCSHVHTHIYDLKTRVAIIKYTYTHELYQHRLII